jgi:non-homologous end joining protein Ku
MGSYKKGLLLSLGLVKVQVDLHATAVSNRSPFKRLCPEHKATTKNRIWCEEGDHEVPFQDAASGASTPDGYRLVTKSNKPEFLASQELELIPVPVKELDENTYPSGGSYYCQPTAPTAEAWAVFKAVLAKRKVAFVAKGQLRNGQQKLWRLNLVNNYLTLQEIVYPEHVRATPEIVTAKPSREHLRLMQTLVDAATVSITDVDMTDDNAPRIAEWVASGELTDIKDGSVAKDVMPQVIDLQEALARSVEAQKKTA